MTETPTEEECPNCGKKHPKSESLSEAIRLKNEGQQSLRDISKIGRAAIEKYRRIQNLYEGDLEAVQSVAEITGILVSITWLCEDLLKRMDMVDSQFAVESILEALLGKVKG